MTKLIKIERTIRKEWKAALKDAGGLIFNYAEDRICIVICPSIKGETVHHARMAVSICSKEDTYNRKRGEFIALQRLELGENIGIRLHCSPTEEGYLAEIANMARSVIR